MDMQRPIRVNVNDAMIMRRLGSGMEFERPDRSCPDHPAQRYVERKRDYRGQHEQGRKSRRSKSSGQRQRHVISTRYGGQDCTVRAF